MKYEKDTNICNVLYTKQILLLKIQDGVSPWARSRTVFLAFLAISFLSFATVQKNHGCFTRFLQLSTSLWQTIEVGKDNFSVLFGYGSRLENTTAKLSQFNFLARKKKTAQGSLVCKLTADWQGTQLGNVIVTQSRNWWIAQCGFINGKITWI